MGRGEGRSCCLRDCFNSACILLSNISWTWKYPMINERREKRILNIYISRISLWFIDLTVWHFYKREILSPSSVFFLVQNSKFWVFRISDYCSSSNFFSFSSKDIEYSQPNNKLGTMKQIHSCSYDSLENLPLKNFLLFDLSPNFY